MGEIRYREGDAEIVLEDVAGDLVRELLEEGLAYVTAPLDRHFAGLEEHVLSEWPVKTGRSRDGFRRGFRVERRLVAAFLTNDVQHTFYVKGRKQKGRRSWTEVVLKESERREDRLIQELGDAVLERHGVI